MIKEHQINGSQNTTFHDFVFTQSGMSITISSGSYYRNGQLLIHSDTGGVITLSSSQTEDIYVEIWLTVSGVEVIQGQPDYIFENNPIPVSNRIDRIGWLTIPQNATTFDDVNIDVTRMVNIDAN